MAWVASSATDHEAVRRKQKLYTAVLCRRNRSRKASSSAERSRCQSSASDSPPPAVPTFTSTTWLTRPRSAVTGLVLCHATRIHTRVESVKREAVPIHQATCEMRRAIASLQSWPWRSEADGTSPLHRCLRW